MHNALVMAKHKKNDNCKGVKLQTTASYCKVIECLQSMNAWTLEVHAQHCSMHVPDCKQFLSTSLRMLYDADVFAIKPFGLHLANQLCTKAVAANYLMRLEPPIAGCRPSGTCTTCIPPT